MKKRFIWLVVSCLMVATLILASCAPAVVEEKEVEGVVKVGPQYGGILTAALSQICTTFDTFDGSAPAGLYINTVLERLCMADYYRDRDKYPLSNKMDYLNPEITVGTLAESWDWSDPLIMTFKIRQGIHWQNRPPANGREFVAEDVAKHFERFLSLPRNSAHILQNIESVSAPDKYTVVFEFKEPNVDMMYRIALRQDGISCPDVYEQLTEEQTKEWEYLIGTGPFYITDFVPDSAVTYTKNLDYYLTDLDGNKLPYIDGFKILIITDIATRIAALRTGKIDLIAYEDPIPWNQKASLEASNPDLQFALSPDGGVWTIYLRSSFKPFQDIRVRKAMSMAINRQEMVDTLLGGNGIAYAWPDRPNWDTYTPLEELPEDIREIYEWKPGNVAEAKQLLAEAGYPNGFAVEYAYNIQGSKYEPLSMEVVQAYLKEIGVDVTLRPVDRGTASSLRNAPFGYEGMFGCGGTKTGVLNMLDGTYRTGGPFNRGVISDPKIDEFYNKLGAEFDNEKRIALSKEVILYLGEQTYDIGMPCVVNYLAWHPWIKGYHGETNISEKSLGQLWSRIWIDQDLKAGKD